MCLHVFVCAHAHARVFMFLCVIEYAHKVQKSTMMPFLKCELSVMVFETISHWPGADRLGYTCGPVSPRCLLSLPVLN